MKWLTIGKDSPEHRVEAQLRRAKRLMVTIAANLNRRPAVLGASS
jgi:hypothetical protein